MDVSVNENKPIQSRPDPPSAVKHTVQGITRWLTGFFTLTEEERISAGIDAPGERRVD